MDGGGIGGITTGAFDTHITLERLYFYGIP
jgi:hypothetical protein